MNKKYIIFLMLGIFAIGIVSAIAYYGFFSASFTVVSAISISGDCSDTIEEEYFGGDKIIGSQCTITNNANTERTISISNDAYLTEDNVSVSYMSLLTLTKKTVNFSADIWNIPEGAEEVIVNYTVIGDEFSAEIVGESNPDYVLVYYKDNADRFNNPATIIGIDSITGNLPNDDDANKVTDYSAEYPTTPHGAKIWYVPSNAITNNVVNWSRANEFYFESKLIQYNVNNTIIMYPGMSLTITPIYTIGDYTTGEYTITTTIA